MIQLTAQQIHVRRWVLITWAALFALVCAPQLQQGLQLTQLGWALVFSLPLLAALPGLLAGRRYTHAWATLCVLPYLVVGVTEAVANAPMRGWALLLLGAALLWFFALLAFLRVTDHASLHTT